jgi:ketosteroid isomerase-like protein
MSRDQNARIAGQLLAGIGGGAVPEEIARLFSADVRFEIAGDIGALPWIGQKIGRAAVAGFVRDLRNLTEPLRFEVQGILADHDRAVILGELATQVIATGRIIETAFALVLTVTGGQITRYQMLEDSFAVSKAARPCKRTSHPSGRGTAAGPRSCLAERSRYRGIDDDAFR